MPYPCRITADCTAQKAKTKKQNLKPPPQKNENPTRGEQSHVRNLTRHKAITLRMTPAEFDFFTNQMRTAKQKTQTDFFLAVLRKKPIIVIEDLRPVLQELKRHGNNLNQITRHLNESNTFGEGATKVMNECWKAYHAITQLERVVLDAVIQGYGGQGQTQESD